VRPVRRALITAALAAALFPAGASAAANCPGANDVPTAATLKAARAATLCLLNNERTARGLAVIHSNTKLRAAATRHSENMITREFFDHNSPAGSTPLLRVRSAGYLAPHVSFQLGENIGWASGDLATPAAMLDAWMHSAGHRDNILHRAFRDIGIGIVVGDPTGGDGVTYTTDFGVRRH
jgi:uncharacterized protein YkwD